MKRVALQQNALHRSPCVRVLGREQIQYRPALAHSSPCQDAQASGARRRACQDSMPGPFGVAPLDAGDQLASSAVTTVRGSRPSSRAPWARIAQCSASILPVFRFSAGLGLGDRFGAPIHPACCLGLRPCGPGRASGLFSVEPVRRQAHRLGGNRCFQKLSSTTTRSGLR